MSSILSTVPLYLLANPLALNRWLDEAGTVDRYGKYPDWELCAYAAFNQRDGSRPDHVFEKRWEKFEKEVSYQKIEHSFELMEAIRLVAEGYLEIVNGRLYVKNECESRDDELKLGAGEKDGEYGKSSHFDRWQNIRARMTTWPLKLYMLHHHHRPADFFLSHPLEPMVADFIRSEGLNETHLHLNGYLYPEEEWLADLYNVPAFLSQESFNYRKDDILKAHYANVNPLLTPHIVANRLKLARCIRDTILLLEDWYAAGCPMRKIPEWSDSSEGDKRNEVSQWWHEQLIADTLQQICRYALNPEFFVAQPHIAAVSPTLEERRHQEMKMWMSAFIMLEQGSDFAYKRQLQHFLHLYLLLENEHIYLNAHTERRKGFAAFDVANDHTKIAVGSEAYYRQTFYRLLLTAEAKGHNYVEVRVTPGALKRNHEMYLRAYEYACRKWEKEQKDWLRMKRELPPQHICRPRLVIVAHLIKKKPKKLPEKSLLIPPLFAAERKEHMATASELAETARHMMEQHRVPVAIDAANSELNQAPEVFAPAYRLFERESNISHKTYHCGEDFLHLISGIRAVYEAITFLNLRNGNRIGHGIAIGIHPKNWVKSMPATVWVSQREWLLNMIFVWKLLHEINPAAAEKAEREAVRVAGLIFASDTSEVVVAETQYHSIHALSHFFEMRQFEPTYVMRWLDKQLPLSSYEEEEGKLLDEKKKEFSVVSAILYKVWNIAPKCRRAQENLIEVKADFLTVPELIQLQQQVQKLIAVRDVVVETLPVSNLRIGQIRRIQSHHVLRWLQVDGYKVEGDSIMNICMGSDDPGVFATDLKNEYYHLYMCLRNANVPAHQAIEYLRRVNNAGRIYAFSKLPDMKPSSFCLSSLLNNIPPRLSLSERLSRYMEHLEQEGSRPQD